MSLQKRNFRALFSLALLRLSPAEIEALYHVVAKNSPREFLQLLRSLEDDFLAEPKQVEKRNWYQELYDTPVYEKENPTIDTLYREILTIAKEDLKISIERLAPRIRKQIMSDNPNLKYLPPLDKKRGFRQWLNDVSQYISPSEIYQAVFILRKRSVGRGIRPWSLRKP